MITPAKQLLTVTRQQSVALLATSPDAKFLFELGPSIFYPQEFLLRPTIDDYLKSVITARRSLILCFSRQLAAAVRSAGLLAEHVDSGDRDTLAEISDASSWWNGIYVLMERRDTLNWAAYEFASDSPSDVGIALWDRRHCDVSSSAIMDCLRVGTPTCYLDAAKTALAFLSRFARSLTSAPGWRKRAARFAAQGRPFFRERFLKECLIPSGVEPREFRKDVRRECEKIVWLEVSRNLCA